MPRLPAACAEDVTRDEFWDEKWDETTGTFKEDKPNTAAEGTATAPPSPPPVLR